MERMAQGDPGAGFSGGFPRGASVDLNDLFEELFGAGGRRSGGFQRGMGFEDMWGMVRNSGGVLVLCGGVVY